MMVGRVIYEDPKTESNVAKDGTETARALFGADPKDGGEVYVNGKKVEIKTPMDAVKCGIGYLSEDR